MLGCGHDPVEPERTDLLARVGDEVISLDDFQRERARLLAEKRPVPSNKELLEQMIVFRAQVQQARTAKLDQNPDFQRHVDKMLVAALQEKQLRQTEVSISEADLYARYKAQQDVFTRPGVERMAMLFLAVDARASEAKKNEVKARITTARQQALEMLQEEAYSLSQGFGALAIDGSDDVASRYRGGDLGWTTVGVPSDRLPEAIWKAGSVLDLGDISPVLHAENGFYVLLKTDVRPPVVTPFESVRSQLVRAMEREQQQAMKAAWEAQCRGAVPTQIFYERLGELPEASTMTKDAKRPVPVQPPSHF